jgi:ATP-binding cassette, subfamily B, bacterial PglK
MNVYKSIFGLIPLKLRMRSFIVLMLVFFGMIMEMLGVGLIIPVFGLVLNTDKLAEYSFFQYLISTFSINDYTYLIYLSLGSLIIVYVFKAIYLSGLAWIQARFVFDLQANISNKLFSLYLRQPYSFHLRRNSAYLIRNVTIETQQLVESAFLSTMLIVNELVVITGLVVLMFILTPSKALVFVSILFVGGILIQVLTKNLLLKWGRIRQVSDGLKIKMAQEGLGGIKEIIVLGRENDILGKFKRQVNIVAEVSANRNAIQQYPRIWIEFLGIISLIFIIILDLLNGLKPIDIIPDVAFIGAIAFRIMPSANRLLSAIQSIKFSTPVVSLIKEELNLITSEDTVQNKGEVVFEDNIKVDNISFFFEANSPVIENVSFEIKKGQKVGIIGSSGAGKSTFIDLILGLHKPSAGVIKVDDVEITDNLRGWQSIIGYVPQTIFLSDDTLRANIALGVLDSEIIEDDVLHAIKLAQLDDFVSEIDEGIETVLGERGVKLSGGQRQRIGIARALYRRPKLLVLDEATSALDNKIEKEVMASIYSLDASITILIVAHRLTTLDGCNEIITLANGKLA